MNSRVGAMLTAVFISLSTGDVAAQSSQELPGGNAFMFPANPASTDTIKLGLSRTCRVTTSGVNLYRVAMAQNNVTVTLGNNLTHPVPLCPPGQGGGDEIELGRFPAGTYTLNVLEPQMSGNPANSLVANFAFTVTDARAAKAAPWVRLDFSGHWWDPADSGWGLFIWQDARSPTDSILAAWFTYAPDGKSMWYVFQPQWQTHAATTTAALLITARPPGPTSPPPGNTATLSVGTASLDFTGTGVAGKGKLTYKFGDGPTLVREIRRFMP